MHHLSLSYLYLFILSFLPSFVLARMTRFAFLPALQISLGNQQAQYWIKIATNSVFLLSAILLLYVFD